MIQFDPNCAHVLGFRHGPRAALPPAGNVWDYWQLVDSAKGQDIARRTIATHFPDLVPAALRCSQLPRSSQTLALLWPDQISQIKLDRRLGIEFEDVAKKWSEYDQYPDAYSWTPQRMHELDPKLVDACGSDFAEAAWQLARDVGTGKVGAMCSHMPIADAGARFANNQLKLFSESDGWLPGNGFGSGAFVHLEWSLKRHPEDVDQLEKCTYYPVPSV